MQEFLGGEAGIDGIDDEAGVFDEDPPGGLGAMRDDVELSEREIWREMKRMLHFGERDGDEVTSEEGSSFYGDEFLNDGDSSGGVALHHVVFTLSCTLARLLCITCT